MINDRTVMIIIRTDIVINKLDEVARMKDMRDEAQAIAKKLSVQGLSIRLECCFLLSNDSKTM